MQSHKSNKLVLFGAGKIGRSFIAQIFNRSGYEVVFVDINRKIIDQINKSGFYNVVIKDVKEEIFRIENISAIHLLDESRVDEEIGTADIAAISVGQNGLFDTVGTLTRAIQKRFHEKPEFPLDIIIAENLRNASEYIRKILQEKLPNNFPVNDYIGLIETSIGKMVPLQDQETLTGSPDVYAEAYNSLILDKKAFKNTIPDIQDLAPKDNIKAWVDRKLFIHNLGHACLAYFSFQVNPGIKFSWEALEDKQIKGKVQKCMKQSAKVLLSIYPDEFTESGLDEHISDLLRRFANKLLGDTIFRIGCDLNRKLGPEDRIVPVIKKAIEKNIEYDYILEALISGFWFYPKDEYGKYFEPDIQFLHKFNTNHRIILADHCKFEPEKYYGLYEKASELMNKINKTELPL